MRLKVQLGKHPNFMKYFKTYYIKVGIIEASHITLKSHFENGHKNSARFYLKIGQFAPFLNENGRYFYDHFSGHLLCRTDKDLSFPIYLMDGLRMR
jgi:hypothetical protein